MTGLVIVCGLASEAKIARGTDDLCVITGGGNSRWVTAELEAAAPTAAGFLSFGVAGGLAPDLKPGSVFVAEMVVGPDGSRYVADRRWAGTLSARLEAPEVTIVGVETPLAGIDDKARLYRRTGASLVDMESHLVAQCATKVGMPFAAIRVVTDPAERALPHAATVGMRSDGKVDLAAILTSLAKNPAQLPALIRTGADAKAAFASLLRSRQLLGPGFAFLDLR